MSQLAIRAQVYAVRKGNTALQMFASVDIGGLLYINSYRLTPTKDEPGKIQVFPPSYMNTKTGKRKSCVEYPNSSSNRLVSAIRQVCITAYKSYEDSRALGVFTQPIIVDTDDIFINDIGEECFEDLDNFNIEEELGEG